MSPPKQWLDQKTDRFPFYLILVLLVLIALLIINGYFEIQRTRSRLFKILETEGLLVIKGIEKNSGNLIGAFKTDRSTSAGPEAGELSEEILGIEDLLIERLINLALRLDQEAAKKNDFSPSSPNQTEGLKHLFFLKTDPSDPSWKGLPKTLRVNPIFFHEILRGKSRLAVYRGEGPLRQTVPLAVAVGRRYGSGLILISLDLDEYLERMRQIIIQGFLDEFSGKGNIAYLIVEGNDGNILAKQGAENRSGQIIQGKKKIISQGNSGLYWIEDPSEEFLEVVRPFKPLESPIGQIRAGMSLKEINPILHQAGRTTLLTSLVLLGLGMISIFVIFRLQGRHFNKMQEMEKQIRLQEELSAMGQLAAGVAHEIKNPLNAISLVVQRLQQEFARHDPLEQKEYERFTGIVRNEIARVNRIIADFLLIAKPLEMRTEECSVVEIINYVLEVLGEEIRRKKNQVIPEWGEDIPSLRCDRFQMTQVFLNIFNNALEAMEEGGEIRLGIKQVRSSEYRKKDLKSKTKEPGFVGDFLEISVQDTGKGIPPQELKRIFAPYYTSKEKGVGLGLAITQKIIRAHGGTLEIENQVGLGTRVTIRLPLQLSYLEKIEDYS
jgi:signal transduction histidine kinase